MARTNTLGNFLTDVAEAIRTKKGTSETIQASNFDTEIVNLPSGGDLDWSAIGYDSTPEFIIGIYNYAKNIKDNWNDNITSLYQKFKYDTNLYIMPLVVTDNVVTFENAFNSCSNLVTIPLLNTNNVRNFTSCFISCTFLKNVPLLNTSSALDMTNMFTYCYTLTDTSLDNILQMCINATSYTGIKTLVRLGISNTSYYPVSRIQALPHYQDFIDAGWTIGY